MLFVITEFYNLKIESMDIETALFYSKINELIHVKMSKKYTNLSKNAIRLLKKPLI